MNGFGDVGGVPKSSIGSSLGDFGGDGDLDGWVGVGGRIGSVGVLVGGGVLIIGLKVGDGVGVARFKKFSSLMGKDMINGDSSEDEELR